MFTSLFSRPTYQGQMMMVVVSSEKDKLYKEVKQQLVCCISSFYIKVWRMVSNDNLIVSLLL